MYISPTREGEALCFSVKMYQKVRAARSSFSNQKANEEVGGGRG